MTRRRLSPAQREAVYERCRAGDDYPRCNIPGCGLAVTPGQRWVVSHWPVPATHGGEATGIAHARCNHDYWCTVEAPIVAKVKRQRRQHMGISGPGRGRHPLPGGRDDPRKRTMDGRVVNRATGEPWGARR